MDIGAWLRSLGLGKYEAAFRENDIDETVLPALPCTSARGWRRLRVRAKCLYRAQSKTSWRAPVCASVTAVVNPSRGFPANGTSTP